MYAYIKDSDNYTYRVYGLSYIKVSNIAIT
jgi:hypothetical protein